MIDEAMLAEIREANLTYLILAQRMMRADRAQAMYRLGISEEVAEIVAALTTAQMIKIASTSMLMCKLPLRRRMVWNLIASNDNDLVDQEGARGDPHGARRCPRRPDDAQQERRRRSARGRRAPPS